MNVVDDCLGSLNQIFHSSSWISANPIRLLLVHPGDKKSANRVMSTSEVALLRDLSEMNRNPVSTMTSATYSCADDTLHEVI